MIYVDNNATTRPAAEAVAAMHAVLTQHWGNPSSPHSAGQAAKRLLAEARGAVARLLGAQPVEVVFTSGATEANHSVLAGAIARSPSAEPPLLVLSAVEHGAMLKSARQLAEAGRIRLQLLPVDGQGRVDLAAAAVLIEPGCALVSVMAANNETGVLQPVAELRTLATAAGALLHVDATQVAGKLPFDFAGLGADLASVSAHKLHGPKGVGALLIRKGLQWPVLLPGTQERGRRGGTENLPGIVGFGVAAQLAAERLLDDLLHCAALREHLETGLRARLPVRVFGEGVARLPNTSLLRIGALDADLVLSRLERRGIVAASGSACSSGGNEPSHVLLAMGVGADEARCALRLSLSRDNRAADVDHLIDSLCSELQPCLAEAA